MIKIYGMPTCPFCDYIQEQIAGREDEFEYINIGEHIIVRKDKRARDALFSYLTKQRRLMYSNLAARSAIYSWMQSQ